MSYINPYYLQVAIRDLLQSEDDIIGGEIRRVYGRVNLTPHFFIGRRKTLSDKSRPSIEIALDSDNTTWFAARTQQMEVSLRIVVTMTVHKERDADFIRSSIATAVKAVLTNPSYLQMQVQSELRAEQGMPLPSPYVMPDPDTSKQRRLVDSFVDSVTYPDISGNLAQAEMSWRGTILQPYKDHYTYFGGPITPGYRYETDFLSS